MTDTDDLAIWRARAFNAEKESFVFLTRAEVAEAQLAAARTVTDRYGHGWSPIYGPNDGAYWAHPIREEEPMSDAERAWLASVSPPTSRDDG